MSGNGKFTVGQRGVDYDYWVWITDTDKFIDNPPDLIGGVGDGEMTRAEAMRLVSDLEKRDDLGKRCQLHFATIAASPDIGQDIMQRVFYEVYQALDAVNHDLKVIKYTGSIGFVFQRVDDDRSVRLDLHVYLEKQAK